MDIHSHVADKFDCNLQAVPVYNNILFTEVQKVHHGRVCQILKRISLVP